MNRVLTIAGAIALAAGSLGVAAQDDQEPNYKYRQNQMRAQAAHAGSIVQIVKGEVAHSGHLSAHASALAALASQVTTSFKQQSALEESRSKPEIWSDWAGFESMAKDFEMAAADVAEAAKSGDAAAVGPKLKPMFDACTACHKKYRGPKKD